MPGDVVEVEVQRVGTLANTVVDELVEAARERRCGDDVAMLLDEVTGGWKFGPRTGA